MTWDHSTSLLKGYHLVNRVDVVPGKSASHPQSLLLNDMAEILKRRMVVMMAPIGGTYDPYVYENIINNKINPIFLLCSCLVLDCLKKKQFPTLSLHFSSKKTQTARGKYLQQA